MGSDRADKPHRRKRDDPDAHNVHPAKHFAYSESKHKDAAALKSRYRAEIKGIYNAYTALSEETTSAEDAAKAFKTIIAACQGTHSSYSHPHEDSQQMLLQGSQTSRAPEGDVNTFAIPQGVRESRVLVPSFYQSLLGSALSNWRMPSKELSTSRWWRLAPTVMSGRSTQRPSWQ